jgi:hypothetical protein
MVGDASTLKGSAKRGHITNPTAVVGLVFGGRPIDTAAFTR